MGFNLKRVVSSIGIICFIAGLASFLVYPDYFAMNTYMSENALSPTWTLFAYSSNKLYVDIARQYTADYWKFQTSLAQNLSDEDWSRETAVWISKKIEELHLNPRVSRFPSSGHSSAFAASQNTSEHMYLVDLVLEAPRSSGAEAVIFTSRFERIAAGTPKPSDAASYSWSFLVSFLHMVQHQHWRSKDIVIVLSPGSSQTRGVEFWMERLSSVKDSDDLKYRHSFIIAALSIDIPPAPRFHALSVKPESVLGTLPNLDLPNSIFRIAYRRDMRYLSWTPSDLVSFEQLPFLYNLAQNPLLSKFLTSDRIGEWNTMISFMLNMAIGEPTGDHSVISKYKIEAVTISASEWEKGTITVKKMGELLEGTLRSLNNLIEPLHQSFYYYIPLTPFTFVPIGHYMISFGLLFVPTATWVLLTIIPAKPEELYLALQKVANFAFVGIVAFLLPVAIPQLLPYIEELAPRAAKDILISAHHWRTLSDFYIGAVVSFSLLAITVYSSHSTKKSKEGNRPVQLTTPSADLLGATAITPYLLFLAAAALINASFALIAIALTLPGIAYTLLSRKGPRLFRLFVSILVNPLVLLYVASVLSESTPATLVSKLLTNWEYYRGLIFPFACLYLSVALQSIPLSMSNE